MAAFKARREQCTIRTASPAIRLAEAITMNVMEILHYGEESVSVAMEEVKSGTG
jgi:phenylpyruvate tautomerase PptA (4-oxalocrotonate tautomerase family)